MAQVHMERCGGCGNMTREDHMYGLLRRRCETCIDKEEQVLYAALAHDEKMQADLRAKYGDAVEEMEDELGILRKAALDHRGRP